MNSNNKQQFYHIQLNSEFVYDEDKYVIVNSYKELKEYVKNLIHWYLRDYFTKHKLQQAHEQYLRDPNRYMDLFSKIRLIYKRIVSRNIYRGEDIRIGKAFMIEYRDNEKNIESLLELWCTKINKRDLLQFTKFKEIEE